MKNQKLFNKHFDAFVLFPYNNFYEELLAINIKKEIFVIINYNFLIL